MRIPWFNKKKKKQKATTQQFPSREIKPFLEFNNKGYSEESLPKETKDLIKEIKRSEEIINQQENKLQLLKTSRMQVLKELREKIC